MNYYILLSITLLLLFLVYTPGIISGSFSRVNTVLQFTFIPYTQWVKEAQDVKGNNWFGTVRVLGGKALKYSQDGSEIHSSYDTVDYFIRICGLELELIIINTKEKKDPNI